MLKRLFDIIFGVIIIIPVILGIIFFSLLVIVFDRLFPIIKQKRVGLNGEEFTCYKIKTMRSAKNEAEINDKKKDEERVTKLGRWMRNRGIDELPQIFNVLLGRMSFVGPRPLLAKNIKSIKEANPEIIELIQEWEETRSRVKPGLSGWHQIHSLGPKVLKYDLEYLKDPSWQKQLKIMLVSTWILIIGKNRYFKDSQIK